MKISLKTRNEAVARARAGIVHAQLEKVYEASRSAEPLHLTHKQVIELSGDAYRRYVSLFEDDPGTPSSWAVFKAFNRAVREGRISVVQPIDPKRSNDDVAAAESIFGFDLTEGVNALPQGHQDAVAMETRFGLLANWVLISRGIEIDDDSRARLLVEIDRASTDAAWRLKRAALGDYSPDLKEERFPRDSLKPSRKTARLMDLFDGWARERQPSQTTVDQWRRHIQALTSFAECEDAEGITKADIVRWKEHLLEAGGSPKTINESKLAAVKATFAWGVRNDRIATNPALSVRVDRKKQPNQRMRGFTDAEAEAILTAAMKETRPVIQWIPLLCATSGARVGEIAQLRVEDVITLHGIPAIHITPDAGSLKNESSERTVPLHPDVIAAGFLEFTKGREGPLFYDIRRRRAGAKKPPHKIVAKNVADWVRGLKLPQVGREHRKDSNHAWRHRFHTKARAAGIPDSVSDMITGRVARGSGGGYGEADVQTMLHAIRSMFVPPD